jgi:hypothetical protein
MEPFEVVIDISGTQYDNKMSHYVLVKSDNMQLYVSLGTHKKGLTCPEVQILIFDSCLFIIIL